MSMTAMQELLLDTTSFGQTDVLSDAAYLHGWLDAFYEAGITLAAFMAAVTLIHFMKNRNQKKQLANSAMRKSAKLSADVPTARKPESETADRKPPFPDRSPDFPLSRNHSTQSVSSLANSDDGNTLRQRASNTRLRQREFGGSSAESDSLVAAVRSGRAAQLPTLLIGAAERVSQLSSSAHLTEFRAQHLLSALRACAAHRCFSDALRAYDSERELIGEGCAAMWSLLLYSAVEAREFHRCKKLIKNLLVNAVPSPNDFLNMVRHHVHQHEGMDGLQRTSGLKQTLQDLREAGFNINVVSRNRALSMCLQNCEYSCAEILVDQRHCNIAMDIVAFNTLIKAFAKNGDVARCFALRKKMQEMGIAPSEITFGILLDVCIDAKDFARAKQVFANLRQSGLPMNVVHYTTFMKGLLSAGYLDEATALLDEMVQNYSTKPDLVTYSTLVKAHADHGKVMEAITVLERMLGQGIPADAIIFNIVLTGCCSVTMEQEKIFHVFSVLVKHGLEASTTTLSILVKALAQSHAWDAALDMLDKARQRYGLWPEPRLYAQLAQACAKVNHGQKAVDCYAAMVRSAIAQGIAIDETTNARLLRCCTSCISCGGSSAATKIHSIVARAGGYPRLQEINAGF